MTAILPTDGRTTHVTEHGEPGIGPPPEPLLIAPPSREHSVTRGRALSGSSSHHASPRGITPIAKAHGRGKQSIDLERKPSLSYGHHRQTSIVNGVQHSRQPSSVTPASSPMSPPKMARSGTTDGTGPQQTLKKSPSLSQLVGGIMQSASANRAVDIHATQRRMPERMHSGRIKRSHEPQSSLSGTLAHPPAQEASTVGEYALHHLFTSFRAQAEDRIERCIHSAGLGDPPIEPVCGPGADSAFDQLIWSLGYISRHKPGNLIHLIVQWRRGKSETTHKLRNNLDTMQTYHTRGRRQDNMEQALGPAPTMQDLMMVEQGVSRAQQHSTISVYITCRVLIGVFEQITATALNDRHGTMKAIRELGANIFDHVKSVEPDSVAQSSLNRANWSIRGQLLGVMSSFLFDDISDLFIKKLEIDQRSLSVKGMANHAFARKTALLVQSMRWIKLRYEPDTAWEKSCETLQLLGTFFADVHGRIMKHAYAELFESLVLPLAALATSQLNSPKWKETLASLQPKINQMLSKADHWVYVYPLQAVLLCASPMEQFSSQWLPLALSSQPKTRDRSSRSHALKAICRLVWRYLYRCPETMASGAKKLDEIVKLVFQGSKRIAISTDPAIADPLIQLIRIIGYREQDYCFRNIIFPLMNAELFTSGQEKDLKIENLDPEKIVIAIRAFLVLMTDLEQGVAPPFPTEYECDAFMDPASRSPPVHRRSRSQSLVLTAGRAERLSRPMMTSNLNDSTKENYVKFCRILGHLTIICDNTFGGQAALDEKFTYHTPKTPMAEAFTFSRRDDLTNPNDFRQQYYDLLHVAVEALPRCLSPQLPINPLVNLLCTGTAHVQSHIATSSAQSLKSIARQSYAQQVTIGFARFIFNFDDRYATVSDGSLLGPGHIENTLQLYVELLQIWIDDIQRRTQAATAEPSDEQDHGLRSLPLDLSSILAYVDEVESHGLFFLCSPSRAVRAIAVEVLRLVTKFDTALGKPSTRIISILEGSSQKVIDVDDERLSLAERSRLIKGLQKNNVDSALVELCSSEVAHDANLWFKIFPNLVRLSAEICLHAVALTRELVCQRLVHSNKTIVMIAEGQRAPNMALQEVLATNKPPPRLTGSSPDIIVEQWKIHLIFACTTLTNVGSAPAKSVMSGQSSQHTRKSSKSSTSSSEKLSSARELFSSVVQFLSVSDPTVRGAAVTGLGATNATIYQTLIEVLRPLIIDCNNDAKERLTIHARNTSNPQPLGRRDFLRESITHLLALTCSLLQDPKVSGDLEIIEVVMEYAKQLRLFLHDAQIQHDLKYQRTRIHFCALIEVYYGIAIAGPNAMRHMSFQSRQAAFVLMETWCGFLPSDLHTRGHHDAQEQLHRSMLQRESDIRSHVIMNSAIEKSRNELMFAALSAMAALCAGPLSFVADNKVLMHFEPRRMLRWVHLTFEAASDRVHAIGRKALQNLIVHNPDQPLLLDQSIRMCYVAKLPKALASYFEVVTAVVIEHKEISIPFWRIACAALYTLGNENSDIRVKSVKLLRALEERHGTTSKLQDLEISVSDRTTTVYKNAQFEISLRLANQHTQLAFLVFSEFSWYFNDLEPDHKRNMVSAMLPWIQTIHLQLSEPNGSPTPTSHMLLVNMFDITVRSSPVLHNEIQALWQALATGPYPANVQMVLDFIIEICMERREQNFVNYAKQVVVFLSKTPAGSRVIEYLLMRITTKDMAQYFDSERGKMPIDMSGIPYVADLSEALPSGGKQTGMSLSQICMILLVDLVVAPIQLAVEKVPVLLQIILVQWDQYIDIVQDNARELLVHLIHELVISKIQLGSSGADEACIENFIDSIRRNDASITWAYTDEQVRPGDEHDRAVSDQMVHVVDEVVRIFSIVFPGIREEMGKTSMEWASSCPVRHAACRSFQIYRCLSVPITKKVVADMLARLSNTIADEEVEGIRIFSLQILTTIRFVLSDPARLPTEVLPAIFWTTCACLGTIHEAEYQEAMSILGPLLTELDPSNEAYLERIREVQPEGWHGDFNGLHSLLYAGMRSSSSMDRALQLMERLIQLPSNDIIGGDERLLFTILSNLPRFLHSFEDSASSVACSASAEILGQVAENQNFVNLARVMQGFAQGRFRSENDFLAQCLTTIRNTYFPEQELASLVFLMGMVNNHAAWFKVKTMQILCHLLPDTDLRKPEIASHGPDLISPLLRLLNTSHCRQALDVLNNVIEMQGTPLNNKHLRMSMAGSHSNRDARREYDNTQSLYGIPEESGWSIPMPASHALATRANVHKVFSYMVEGMQGDITPTPTPDVEFYRDDYNFDSFFSDRSDTMASDDTRVDRTLGELAEKLETLDDFFDDPLDSSPPASYAARASERRQQSYSQSPQRIGLRRDTSGSSYRLGSAGDSHLQNHPMGLLHPQHDHGFAPMPDIPREFHSPPSIKQAAFSSHATQPLPSFSRPGLHNRSITSPAVNVMRSRGPMSAREPPTTLYDFMSGDEAEYGESFSDDDMPVGRALALDRPFQHYNNAGAAHMNAYHTVKAGVNHGASGTGGFKAGIRSGIRRLTSTGTQREAREAIRAGLMKSPQVPRVPAAFVAGGAAVAGSPHHGDASNGHGNGTIATATVADIAGAGTERED